MYCPSHDLTNSLQSLTATSQNLTTEVPPEIVDYLEEGRNPDIYTREFVELVQKGNQYLKGKSEALGSFRDILAEEIVAGFPELRESVKDVLEGKVINGEVKVQNENGGTEAEGITQRNGDFEEKR